MKKNVLFICTGNSVRSQMADGYLRKYGSKKFNVYSAGIKPAGVHPFTKKVMLDDHIDMSSHKSNHVDEMLGINFDYVIVLCEVAILSIPKFDGDHKLTKWFMEDPIRMFGSDEHKIKAFTYTRDLIRGKVMNFVEQESKR